MSAPSHRLSIPLETQLDPWSCGAAALTMVYRSFGLAASQDEIWKRLSQSASGSSGAATAHVPTHRLAVDAIDRGFSALVLQVQGDWLAVRRCFEVEARCIVNHRIENAQTAGHFSVLTELDRDFIAMNDPLLGPRRYSYDSFLRLWGAGMPSLSVPGLVAVVIAHASPPAAACPLCGTNPPTASERCKRCDRLLPLEPAFVLGCLRKGCPMRSWDRLYCPWCDQRWG